MQELSEDAIILEEIDNMLKGSFFYGQGNPEIDRVVKEYHEEFAQTTDTSNPRTRGGLVYDGRRREITPLGKVLGCGVENGNNGGHRE